MQAIKKAPEMREHQQGANSNIQIKRNMNRARNQDVIFADRDTGSMSVLRLSDCIVFAIGTCIAIHVNVQRGIPVIGGEALLPLVLLSIWVFIRKLVRIKF